MRWLGKIAGYMDGFAAISQLVIVVFTRERVKDTVSEATEQEVKKENISVLTTFKELLKINIGFA